MEYNVLFYGLPEEHNENCENKILKLIQSDLKVPPRDVYSVENVIGEVRVDIAHRVGRRSADRKKPRPIVVQFLSRKGKLIVLQHAQNLKGSRLSISEQLPPLVREQRMA